MYRDLFTKNFNEQQHKKFNAIGNDWKFMVQNYISLTKALATKEETKSVKDSQS